MPKAKLLKDPTAIRLLQDAEKILEKYTAYVLKQYPNKSLNYRYTEGRAALREVVGLRKEEQHGWIE